MIIKSMLNYTFTQDVETEINNKTSEIIKLLNYEGKPEDVKENFKLFHSNTRSHSKVVKHILHNKLNKLLNDINDLKLEIIIPFEDYLKNNNHETKIWDYIIVMYMLYENSIENSDSEILTAYINRIIKNNQNNDSESTNISGLPDLSNISGLPDLSNISGLPDLTNLMQGINIPELMKGFKSDQVDNNLLSTIISDIKTNLNTNGDNVDNLFNSAIDIGKKYQNMIVNGEISLDKLMGSMVGMLSNPDELKKTVEDINIDKLPNPEKIMNKLMSEMGGENSTIGPIIDKFKNMINNGNNSSDGFDPLKMVTSILNNTSTDDTDNVGLTDEQIKEMEEFYSNLNI